MKRCKILIFLVYCEAFQKKYFLLNQKLAEALSCLPMKRFMLSAFLVFFVTSILAQKKGWKQVEIEGKISILIPNSFSAPLFIQNSSDSSGKFGNIWIVRDQTGKVTLQYKIYAPAIKRDTILTDNAIPEITDNLLTAMKKDPAFKYIDDGILLQDGKNIGYIKGTTPHNNKGSYYHFIFFTTVDGKLLHVNFWCPTKNMKKWEPIADEIANSLRVIPAD